MWLVVIDHLVFGRLLCLVLLAEVFSLYVPLDGLIST